MEVKASLRHLRIAPRKVRLVIGLIRGKSVQEAERQLMHLAKLSAQPILKLLLSAKANAKNNFDLNPEDMYIKSITANEGTTLKRYLPRAMGKADILRKRATHIDMVLAERVSKDAGKGKPGRTDSQSKAKTDDKKSDSAKPSKREKADKKEKKAPLHSSKK